MSVRHSDIQATRCVREELPAETAMWMAVSLIAGRQSDSQIDIQTMRCARMELPAETAILLVVSVNAARQSDSDGQTMRRIREVSPAETAMLMAVSLIIARQSEGQTMSVRQSDDEVYQGGVTSRDGDVDGGFLFVARDHPHLHPALDQRLDGFRHPLLHTHHSTHP